MLTLDRQLGGFPRADVLIEDGKIREVRPDMAVSQDMAVVDASNRIVIPGFIDTHSHSYQGILRNILANGRVDPDYNRDIVGTLTPAFTAQDAYVGMLATALGMIDMGTTGVVDVSQVNKRPSTAMRLFARSRIPASGRSSPTRAAMGRQPSIRTILSGCSAPISLRRNSC